MAGIQTIKLGKNEYVVIPKRQYLKLQERAGVPRGSVDAIAYAKETIAETLKAARHAAGLTQTELAQRLGRTQATISAAENGNMSVGERYVASLLKACKLPEDWKPPATKRARSRSKR